MNKLDEALFALGKEQAEKAGIAENKARVLRLAARNGRARPSALPYALAAAMLVAGLAAGVITEREGWLYSEVPLYQLPMTDGPEPQCSAKPLEQWSEYVAEDILLDNMPINADTTTYQLNYIPLGMKAHWEHSMGLLEVSDEKHCRSILAKPCLRFELLQNECEGLAVGYARAIYSQNEAGELSRVNWVLRLNRDVYLHVSTQGLTYEDSKLFVESIKGG